MNIEKSLCISVELDDRTSLACPFCGLPIASAVPVWPQHARSVAIAHLTSCMGPTGHHGGGGAAALLRRLERNAGHVNSRAEKDLGATSAEKRRPPTDRQLSLDLAASAAETPVIAEAERANETIPGRARRGATAGSRRDCSCAGTNENCVRCDGKGWYEREPPATRSRDSGDANAQACKSVPSRRSRSSRFVAIASPRRPGSATKASHSLESAHPGMPRAKPSQQAPIGSAPVRPPKMEQELRGFAAKVSYLQVKKPTAQVGCILCSDFFAVAAFVGHLRAHHFRHPHGRRIDYLLTRQGAEEPVAGEEQSSHHAPSGQGNAGAGPSVANAGRWRANELVMCPTCHARLKFKEWDDHWHTMHAASPPTAERHGKRRRRRRKGGVDREAKPVLATDRSDDAIRDMLASARADKRLDGTTEDGRVGYRDEAGRFLSSPSHDRFDDESDPD